MTWPVSLIWIISLLCWLQGSHTNAPVPVNQSWRIWVNVSYESNRKYNVPKVKQIKFQWIFSLKAPLTISDNCLDDELSLLRYGFMCQRPSHEYIQPGVKSKPCDDKQKMFYIVKWHVEFSVRWTVYMFLVPLNYILIGNKNPHYIPTMGWRPSQVYNGNSCTNKLVSS